MSGGSIFVYPASGYRVSSSGSLNYVGTSGYSWSSAPYSVTEVRGSLLSFSSSVVYPEDYNNRSFGFPVRCVQE